MSDNQAPSPEAAPAPAAAPAALTANEAFDASLVKARAAAEADLAPLVAKPEAAPEPVKPAEPAKAKADIDIDPDTLRSLTSLQKKNREYEVQLKELKAQAEANATAAEAMELMKSGKKLEAMAKLTGDADATEAFQKFLSEFLEAPETNVETKTASAIKALEEKLEAEVKARAEEKKTYAEKQAEQERKAAIGFATSKIDADKFELCAKKENRQEMAETALEAVPLEIRADVEKQLGADYTPEALDKYMSELTQDDYAVYFERVYVKLEAQLEEMGKRYTKTPKTPAPAATPAVEATPTPSVKRPTASSLSRPSVSTVKTPAGPMTADEAFEASLARARAAAVY